MRATDPNIRHSTGTRSFSSNNSANPELKIEKPDFDAEHAQESASKLNRTISPEVDDEVQQELGTPYEKKTMSGGDSLSPHSTNAFIMKNPSNINIVAYPER